MHHFTNEQIEFIRKIAKGKDTRTITELVNNKFGLNLKISQIQSCKSNHNIKSDIDCRFKKGNIPANKGKKGSMNPEQYEKCKATMFKKGNIPPNRREIGSERIDKNGYVEIKIQDGKLNKNWIKKHRYIYEQANGKIPKGHKVIFADGNNRNFEIKNLILVTNAEELIMNKRKLIGKNPDFTKTGAIIAKVLNKARTR